MIYFDSSYLAIEFNETLPIVLMRWKTITTSNELHSGLEKGLQLIKEKNLNLWFADVQKLGAISEDDQLWSNEEWFPRAIAGGIKRMAIIVSSDIFNQMTGEEIMSNVPQIGFTSQFFKDETSALNWLKES